MDTVSIEKLEPFKVRAVVGSFVGCDRPDATLTKLQEMLDEYDSLELRKLLNNTTIVFCNPFVPDIIFRRDSENHHTHWVDGDCDSEGFWDGPNPVTNDVLREVIHRAGVKDCMSIPLVGEMASRQALCNLSQQVCDAATLKAFFVELNRRSEFDEYHIESGHIETCIRYAAEQCWIDHDYNYGSILDGLLRWIRGESYFAYPQRRDRSAQFTVQEVAYLTFAMCMPGVKVRLDYPPVLDAKEVGICWEVVRLLVLDLPAGIDVKLPLDFLRQN